MTFDFKLNVIPAPKVAALSIDFLVIGGGIAGLSCAIALRRVGHRVTVLERHTSVYQATGGCRMPPNLSKVLFHWGLEQDVRKIGLKSQGIDLKIFETGEGLGSHSWDVEMLEETRGEFIFSTHADLRKLLHDTALSLGAKVRMGADVTGVDPTTRRVKLANGEILTGDVIIGADGVHGMCRRLVVEEDGDDEPTHRLNVYSSLVPIELLNQDPELEPLFDSNFKRMFGWFGNSRSALAYPVGVDSPAMAIYTYGPKDGNEGGWGDEAPVSGLEGICATAESRLRKLAKLAPIAPACLPILEFPELEDWVHDSGRLIVVGDAAHPMPAGGIQDAAMALEDGAVLAKLFSHIRTADQVPTLLYAFQDLRQPHSQRVLQKELQDLHFMSLPPCEVQEGRDAMMRAKRDAGLDVLDAGGDEEEMQEWAEIKDVFGYDAEDDADNWWMEWGLLRERARGTDVSCGFVEPVAIHHGRMSISEAIRV